LLSIGNSIIPGARFISENDCEFVLWAPHAFSVQLIIVKPLPKILFPEKDKDNYWRIVVADCRPGTRYFYQIDNKEPLPDPASVSQPDGIEGSSDILNFSDMNWEDQEWHNIPFSTLIIYELHVGTYSPEGTFDGLLSKLDYLSRLGINAIEIMPVSQFSGQQNWGYDGVFSNAVQNTYGGAFGFMKLINECHKRGIALILDVVYNHHGPEGNYINKFAPYMSETHSTAWGKAFNYDGPHCEGVRNFFVQNALMWFRDFHIDGLRMDAVHAMHDNSEKHIIREISEAVRDLNIKSGKSHYLIGEVNLNDVAYTRPIINGGYGLDAQWNDDFHHALHIKTTGEKNGYYVDFTDKTCFANVLKKAFILDGKYSKFRGRGFGKPAGTTTADKFIVYSQNHDQVGNRRYGDRKSSLVSFEMQKLIAACVILSPYIPMLFMGEEFGEVNPFRFFIDFKSEYLNQLITRGRDNEFKMLGYKVTSKGYCPMEAETIKGSKLNWKLTDANIHSAKIYNFYKKLIEIRKTHLVLRIPDRKKMIVNENKNKNKNKKLLTIKRWQGRHKVIMLLNFSKRTVKYKIDAENRKYYKTIDSSDLFWGGIGSRCPTMITDGNYLYIGSESIVVYSTM
jgi:maltooligosyltrehalose trehalohydrolase